MHATIRRYEGIDVTRISDVVGKVTTHSSRSSASSRASAATT